MEVEHGPRNHPDFYYTDGNLALGCKAKHGEAMTYFRVHKGYLAQKSIVMNDMLSLPDVAEDRETHEGHPLVKFSQVDAETMEQFLTFFYVPGHELLSPNDLDVAFKLFDVLVVADMYFVDDIKKAILDRIRQDWTMHTFEEYSSRFKQSLGGPVDPASVLRVGRRFDQTIVTPLLLFELSFRDPFKMYPISLCFGEDEEPASWDNIRETGARWDLVSPKDRWKAGQGRQMFFGLLERCLESLSYVEDTELFTCPGETAMERELCDLARWARGERSLKAITLCGTHPFMVLQNSEIPINNRHYDFDFFSSVIVHGKTGFTIHEGCARFWNEGIKRIQIELFKSISTNYEI